MKFEYTTKMVSTTHAFSHHSDAEMEYLKEMGDKGWELVSVVSTDMGQRTTYYWKRRLPSNIINTITSK